MGLLLWLLAALLAFATARLVPLSPKPAKLVEGALVTISSLLLGATATIFDFGGWREPDWRAALFVYCGCMAVLGVARVRTLSRHVG